MDELFNSGSSFHLHPFTVYHLSKNIDLPAPAQVLISVPKKNFHLAADRNRIKRLIREAYRQNKHLLYSALKQNNLQLVLGLIYSAKKIEASELIQEKITSVLQRLIRYHVIPEKSSE